MDPETYKKYFSTDVNYHKHKFPKVKGIVNPVKLRKPRNQIKETPTSETLKTLLAY